MRFTNQPVTNKHWRVVSEQSKKIANRSRYQISESALLSLAEFGFRVGWTERDLVFERAKKQIHCHVNELTK